MTGYIPPDHEAAYIVVARYQKKNQAGKRAFSNVEDAKRWCRSRLQRDTEFELTSHNTWEHRDDWVTARVEKAVLHNPRELKRRYPDAFGQEYSDSKANVSVYFTQCQAADNVEKRVFSSFSPSWCSTKLELEGNIDFEEKSDDTKTYENKSEGISARIEKIVIDSPSKLYQMYPDAFDGEYIVKDSSEVQTELETIRGNKY